jgi:hypothetical protein
VRSIFLGTLGFLGRIDGPSACAFWADDPEEHDFDAGRLISVDLARTPSAAVRGRIGWDEVQTDDCFAAPNGALGGTTIGPLWPELKLAGAVYLEAGYHASLPEAVRPPCPPSGVDAHAYEFMAAVYWPGTGDPRAGQRYAGHHARVVAEQGPLARVAVYPPGRSSAADPVLLWVDIDAPDQCDASLTTIGVGDQPKTGALFLISGQVG